MRKQILFGLFIIIMSVASCRPQTNTTTQEEAPVPTGSIEGFTVLYDEFGNAMTSNAGVTVRLDSTGLYAITDNNGVYVLKNVPANTSYNFTFSKNGFASYHYADYAFVLSSGAAPVLSNVGNESISSTGVYSYKAELYPVSATTIQSFVASASTNSVNVTANVSNSNPAYTPTYPIGAQFFISTSKNVSPTFYSFTTTAYTNTGTPGVASTTFSLSNTYPVGTTIYIVAYGITAIPSKYGNLQNPNINPNASSIITLVTQ